MKDLATTLMQMKTDLYLNDDISKDTITKISEEMKSDEIQKYIKYLLHSYSASESISETDRMNLKFIIDIAQAIYNYSGKDTGLSDFDYDKLYELLENDEITVPIISRDKITHHKYKTLRGTLTKIYYLDKSRSEDFPNRKGLPDWIHSRERMIYQATGQEIDLGNENIFVFPKWDGVSVIFEFNKNGELQRALTRGYTTLNEATDITHIFKGIVHGPKMDTDYGLKTEVLMREKDFKKYQKSMTSLGFKNSRSIVSSIINSQERDSRVNDLVIQSLRTCYLLPNGEESLQEVAEKAFDAPYIKCKLKDIDKISEFAEDHRYTEGLRCDGAVIYLCNEKLRKILGRKDDKNNYEVAYKFTEEATFTKIKDIIFQVGILGRVSPVAVVEPVTLKGNRINRVSLGSISRCKSLHLSKGDTVQIRYDIIPYLVFNKNIEGCKKNKEEPEFKIPEYCPYCGHPLEYNEGESILQCVNDNCDCRQQGKILNYLNKLNIANISSAIVSVLYNEGYLKSIPDLYTLEKNREHIENIKGLGFGIMSNIISEINSHKVVKDYDFLGALGISNIGSRKFKMILDEIPMDTLIEYVCMYKKGTIEEETLIDLITTAPGIQKKTAKMVVEGLTKNIKMIKKLSEILTITHPTKLYTVCFSNIRSDEMEKWIDDHQGEVVDNVNEKLSLLIVDSLSSDSGKIKKAKKYDIPIVTLDDAKEYIKNMIK